MINKILIIVVKINRSYIEFIVVLEIIITLIYIIKEIIYLF